MIKRSGQVLGGWVLGTDLGLTLAAWAAAYPLRFVFGVPAGLERPGFHLCLRNLPLVGILAVVAYRIAGQYQVHRLRRFREETVAVAKGVALLILMVTATTFWRQDPYESRGIMLLFALMTGAGVLAARRLSWTAVRRLRSRGYNQSPCLIVGTGRVARKLAAALKRTNWIGLRTVGFVEDPGHRWAGESNVLGAIAELPELVERHRIGHVFIALPMNRYADARRVYDGLSGSLT